MKKNKEQTMNVLVLAKSAKNHELCVAGIDLDTNKLVRLVADESGKEIKKTDFKMDDEEVQVFDKITIKCTPAPLKIQTENVILNKIDKIAEHYDADKADKIFKEKNQAQLGNDLTRMKKQLKQLQDAEQAIIDQLNS